MVDRLAHWWFWGSEIDALNALALRRMWASKLDHGRLHVAAEIRRLSPAFDSLERFVERQGEAAPTEEELKRWARRSMK